VLEGATTCSASHTYADDNPTATLSDGYTVAGTVADNGTTNGAADPLSDTSTQAITVNNVAPVVTITDPAAGSTVPVGTSIAVRATYTDAGTQDTHTCTVNGSPGIVTPDPEVDGAGTCTGTVTAAPGANTITVVVTDDDLGQGTASVTVSGLYAIYAHERCTGGAGKGIIVNGARADIDGAIHSNGMFTINGSYFQSSGASIFRSATNACKAVYSSTANFGPPTPTAPTKEASARNWPVNFAPSEFACTFTGAEFVFNRSGQVIPSGVYCASKSFKINASNVMGDITVIAPEIVINGKSISLKPYARGVLLLGTSTKEIVIDSDFSADTTASLSGLIHNPAGGIKVNGQAVRIQHGFLQGLWVEVNLTGFSMTYPAR
jgi:hypothetical protein